VGASKWDPGEGRVIPLNSDVLTALAEHSKWFLRKFGTTHPSLYVFPLGKPQPTDAMRPMVTLKDAWARNGFSPSRLNRSKMSSALPIEANVRHWSAAEVLGLLKIPLK
jgi:hypothetical protein